jgi:hypothetical protein
MMMNDLILKRKITVNCWNIEAKIAKEKERNELMFILMYLRENPNSTAQDLSKESFFDTSSRVIVAERLLNIANLLGLVEKKASKGKNTFSLADDGKKALETKKVFVPEEGAWTILASDDPLLPFPILSVDIFNEPRAINEVHKPSEREFEKLPSWVTQTVGSTDYPCLGKQVMRFDDLKPKAEINSDEKLQIEWNTSKGTLRLKGNIAGKSIDRDIEAPSTNFENIWQELLEGEDWWEDWNEENQTLAIEFENTVEQERQSMLGDFIFEQPYLEKFGNFEKLAVNKISFTPLSSLDAQQWAEWRLENSFNDYVTKTNFVTWQELALEPFSEFKIDLPSRQILAQNTWQDSKLNPTTTSWHLIATEDWNI